MDKHSWHKQMAAKMARHSYADQMAFLDGLTDATETERLLSLERKFFLSRKDANNAIATWEELNA